jgi:AraC-like DNA-binding protein
MRYREQHPETTIGRWIECTWSLETAAAVPAYPVRPDGCIDIVYAREGGAQVVGAMTAERRFHLAAGARTIGVRFHPGMAGAFLGASPAEFTGRTVALEDVWGRRARQLERRLADARSLDECLGNLRDALAAPPREPSGVQRAIGAMTAAHGDLDLDWAARHAGLSARQFRRRCLQESGLSPKRLCRVLRFRRACSLAARGAGWVSVAGDAGYFDQAHLIRDFREFAGVTPMAVFSKTQTASIG